MYLSPRKGVIDIFKQGASNDDIPHGAPFYDQNALDAVLCWEIKNNSCLHCQGNLWIDRD
jgi:hypothetical protein